MGNRLKGLGPLKFPDPVPAEIYSFSLVGPAALTAALVLQVLLTALLVVPPPPRPVEDLSQWGEYLFYPEWDIALYLAALVLAAALGAAFIAGWNRRLTAVADPPTGSRLVKQTYLQVAVAVAGTAAYLWQFTIVQSMVVPPDASQIEPARYLGFAIIAAATAGAALGARTSGGGHRPSVTAKLLRSDAKPDPARRLLSLWDLIVPPAVAALIYVPNWREVAGRVFVEETLLHWDYFAMGPALALRNGLALGSEVHAAYGFGWAMVFAGLSEWFPLSYGRMIQVGSIYACIYLIGVYLLLRLVTHRPFSAAVGTALAMTPFFLWMQDLIIWRTPNVTVLRWPFDVWCFIALWMYWRSHKRVWAVVAGSTVGLALVFVIDTGAELAAATGFYWLCILGLEGDRRKRAQDLALWAAVALGVLATGLAIAGRGRIFNADFITGWLEAPLEFSGGFGMLPIVTSAPAATVVSFALLVIGYLSVVIYSLARLIHRRARHFEVFNGFLAAYGLLLLTKFVGHSHESILPRLVIPATILAAILIDKAAVQTGAYLKSAHPRALRTLLLPKVPYALISLAALGLAATPAFIDQIDDYPGFATGKISTDHRGAADPEVCLLTEPRDLCGLPPHMQDTAQHFQAIVDRLEALKKDSHRFAVVDETGSLFYVATGTAPYGRYSRPFTAAHTKDLVEDVRRSFKQDPPDYVLIRLGIEPETLEFVVWGRFGYGPGPYSHYQDTWEILIEAVHQDYELESEIFPYQLWRLKELVP
ncbi:MAG: hypothetical protein WD602_01380 [Actinomycetota bacterium]